MRFGLIFLAACGSTPASPMDGGTDAQQEAAIADTGVPSDSGGLPGKRVFVSSQEFFGADLKSPVDADQACAAMAKKAGVSGAWKAWLSDGIGSSPATRFSPPFQGPYVLAFDPARQVVPGPGAFGKELDHAIDVDENGVQRAGNAWTQTTPGGDDIPESPTTGDACQGWASSTAAHSAVVGNIASTTTAWTTGGLATCSNKGRIYCFEQ